MTDRRETTSASDDTVEVSGIVLFLRDCVRHWVLAVLIVAASLLVGLALALTSPDVYTAEVTLLPQIQAMRSDLIGTLATVTGFGGLEASTYEELYGDILHSDRVLDRILAVPWGERLDRPDLDLAEILGLERGGEETPDAFQTRLKRALRLRAVDFSRAEFSGFMTISVSLPGEPQLAAAIANELAISLAGLIRELRIDKATDNRRFVAERLEAVEAELAAAENAQTEFEINNRGFESSPALRQRHAQLARDVQALTSIWVTLKRELEVAEIEEQEKSVALTVLDTATAPLEPSAPNRVRILVVSLILGGLVAMILVAAREHLPRVYRVITTRARAQ